VAAAAAQPRTDPDQALFTEQCAMCHGAWGDGGSAPDLTNPAWLAGMTDADLERIIRQGVPNTAMPGFGDKLDEAARQPLVRHLRSLGNQSLQPATSVWAPKVQVSAERSLNTGRDPDHWLMWGGNYASHSFSSLRQINKN